MDWDPSQVDHDPSLIQGTQGGLHAPDGSPIVLGFKPGSHTSPGQAAGRTRDQSPCSMMRWT
ncbi:MAG: hypothetical protein JO329_25920 [Planctomycetaceae bacterium]|nr:hypothetical protein [Planctomycetaceae bacterium]MBV8266813.1 hypothetical protein [Planctomycetaceae bacterium]MBV8607440.1 hypothetical protein [Singulisphaera sp.]